MFISGKIYNRQELHTQFGGQEQSGICTPSKHPMIWMFAGKQGEQYGYEDKFEDDGLYHYTGQGRTGDMKWSHGNTAIRDHARRGKSLHLFEYASSGTVRYVSEMVYATHRIKWAPDKNGDLRRAIVFELVPTDSAAGSAAAKIVAAPPKSRQMAKRSLSELRELALEVPPRDATVEQRKRNAYHRSAAVRAYVLRRANGICEGCRSAAPFDNAHGDPYLEPHHIRRRADGGPDHPRWVVALCPNCHRRVHFGRDGEDYNGLLAQVVGALEEVDETGFVAVPIGPG